MSEPEWADAFEGATIADERWLLQQQDGASETAPLKPFAGLSHTQVLALEFPEERMLVEDLVPIGAVGTIAGVPETYKSWQAQHLAVMVASGQGELFGKQATHTGPVGYFWQDDSTREEAERVKLYDRVHRDGSELDVRWFLNEGLRLPDDMERLRATIVEHRLCMVVLDSFYNVLFGLDLKDEGAEIVISRLKSEVCDVTNCTVLIVDHMPWATQENRKRLRAYGGVFKGAAIRFGIYLDAVGNKLYAEGRGNNITGFKRQLAEWDSEALELRLLGSPDAVSEEEYEERILEYLADKVDVPTADLSGSGKKIKGDNNRLVAARKRLFEEKKALVRRRENIKSGPYLWSLVSMRDSTSMTLDSYQGNTEGPYGSMTSMPLRGGIQVIPPSDTPNPLDEV